MNDPFDQKSRERDCAEKGHRDFSVIKKVFKRSPHYSEPLFVRCVWCGRTWPVITKDSWIPSKLRGAENS